MLYKSVRLIFALGVIIIIFLLANSIFNDFRKDPVYSLDFMIKTGFVTKNEVVKIGDGRIHEISYKFQIHHKTYEDRFQSNLGISKLHTGDSIILEVDQWEPITHRVIGYYETIDHKIYKRLF